MIDRRLVVALAAGVATVPVVLLVLAGMGALFTVRQGIAPDGPACSYEIDPGSGPAGSGVEVVEWSPFPERMCRATDGPGADASWPGPSDPSDVVDWLLWWAGAGLAACLAGAAVAVVVARRGRASSQVSGVMSLT